MAGERPPSTDGECCDGGMLVWGKHWMVLLIVCSGLAREMWPMLPICSVVLLVPTRMFRANRIVNATCFISERSSVWKALPICRQRLVRFIPYSAINLMAALSTRSGGENVELP